MATKENKVTVKYDNEVQKKHVTSDLVRERVKRGDMTLEKAMSLTTQDKLPDKGNLEAFGLGYYSQMEIWAFQKNRARLKLIEYGFTPEEVSGEWFATVHAEYLEEA